MCLYIFTSLLASIYNPIFNNCVGYMIVVVIKILIKEGMKRKERMKE
jgi:hypothetical protein